MLLEFSVTNYRSFKEKQTLSLAASNYYKDCPGNKFETGIKGLPNLLHTTAIYGPNASGKSNLIKALSFMQRTVVESASRMQKGEEFKVKPFLLDSASAKEPSEFEVNFIENGVRYQYGFALTRKRVVKEWLIAYPEGRPQKWFEREYDSGKDADEYRFGPKFKGGVMRFQWRNATRSNALFLSTAIQMNNEQLVPVHYWFMVRLRIVMNSVTHDYTAELCFDPNAKKVIAKFLAAADLSIHDIHVEKKPFNKESILSDVPKDLVTALAEDLTNLHKSIKRVTKEDGDADSDVVECRFLHKRLDTGELIPFDPTDESRGTNNLFAFAGHVLDIFKYDLVLFIDEFESSLHPLVVQQLVKMVNAFSGKAQLIFTTHNTSIMSKDLLRRDQIWFAEKNRQQATELFPLSDFKVREQEAIERGYLSGRYGAIPILQEFHGKTKG